MGRRGSRGASIAIAASVRRRHQVVDLAHRGRTAHPAARRRCTTARGIARPAARRRGAPIVRRCATAHRCIAARGIARSANRKPRGSDAIRGPGGQDNRGTGTGTVHSKRVQAPCAFHASRFRRPAVHDSSHTRALVPSHWPLTLGSVREHALRDALCICKPEPGVFYWPVPF